MLLGDNGGQRSRSEQKAGNATMEDWQHCRQLNKIDSTVDNLDIAHIQGGDEYPNPYSY
jgi:hypothetical protein